METTFRSFDHKGPSLASRGARLSLQTCVSPLYAPTGALVLPVLVSMAGTLGDPVGGGCSDGAACVSGSHMATSSEIWGIFPSMMHVLGGFHSGENAELAFRGRKSYIRKRETDGPCHG